MSDLVGAAIAAVLAVLTVRVWWLTYLDARDLDRDREDPPRYCPAGCLLIVGATCPFNRCALVTEPPTSARVENDAE